MGEGRLRWREQDGMVYTWRGAALAVDWHGDSVRLRGEAANAFSRGGAKARSPPRGICGEDHEGEISSKVHLPAHGTRPL